MKKVYTLIIFVIALSYFSMFIVSACISDMECAGQGNNICQNKQILSYQCIDNSCQKSSEIGSVECCSDSDCASDQVCDTRLYKCAGGSPYGAPINLLSQTPTREDNTSLYIIIIAGAIILGFIILAIILGARKKK